MISQEEQSMMLRDQESRKEEQNNKRIFFSPYFLDQLRKKENVWEGENMISDIFIIRKKIHVQKNTKFLDGRNCQK